MSFTGRVKEELSGVLPAARHCRIAELSALLCCLGRLEEGRLRLQTERLTVARKYYILLSKVFRIRPKCSVRRRHGSSGSVYTVTVTDPEQIGKILQTAGIPDQTGSFADTETLFDESLLTHSCCRRAMIRGAFLASGSISDPSGHYHLEISTSSSGRAKQLVSLLAGFGISARIVKRKKYQVIYIKDGDQIVDTLNVMGAHNALLEMENQRVVKDVRNSVNRKVNCETANIVKAVEAAGRQCDDIRLIRDRAGFASLSPKLEEIARLRLANPDISLVELGKMLDPPIGKSGVNHRLARISEIADELRGG